MTSREEFEAWYRKSHMWAPEDNPLALSDSGTYFAIAVSGKWRAWEASREAVAIEVPELRLCCEDFGVEFIKNIEAAGVRIKP